ncbi:hypothetical protein FRC14_004477 [Serendipita sp. 396]|nr:hypothetical protein FRC14_004477 [Serendipita sp. 396]
MAFQQRPEIKISADEINALIHSYMLDSGFAHSAFTFRNETNLGRSPLGKMTFRRGQLTELLVKSLLYIEVETHWKKQPGSCNEPFTLLGAHNCKYSEEKDTTALAIALPGLKEEQKHKSNGKDTADEDMKMFDNSLPSEPSRIHEIPISRQILLVGHQEEVFCTSWNPSFHDLLATGSKDGTAKIWRVDAESGNPGSKSSRPFDSVKHIEDNVNYDAHDIGCLDWSRDGNFLATASSDDVVRIWSRSSQALLHSFRGHTDTVGTVRFSPSGTHLLSSSFDGFIILWEIRSENRIVRKYEHKSAEGENLPDIAWINDTTFACSWPGALIHVFVTTSPAIFRTYRGHTQDINLIRVTLDRKLLASVSDDKTVRIWKFEPLRLMWKSGEVWPSEGSVGGEVDQGCLHVLQGHGRSVATCKWAPPLEDGTENILITLEDDKGPIRLWDAKEGTCLKTFTDHTLTCYGVTFSPDARFLALAGLDGWLYIYSLKTHEIVRSWTERTERKNKRAIYEIDWSKDGNRLAVCLQTGTVAILDVTDLKQ